MLRLRPSVISLTMGEVMEYECRRRFQRYLELEDGNSRSFETNVARRDVPPVRIDSSLIPLPCHSVSPISVTKQTQSFAASSRAPPPVSMARDQTRIEQRTEDSPLPPSGPRRSRHLERLASFEEQIAAERQEIFGPPNLWMLAEMPRRNPAKGLVHGQNSMLPPGPWEMAVQQPLASPLIHRVQRDLDGSDGGSDSGPEDVQALGTRQLSSTAQEHIVPERRSSRGARYPAVT